jgi:hypothetical protein
VHDPKPDLSCVLQDKSRRDAKASSGQLIVRLGLVGQCVLAAIVIGVAIWATAGSPKMHSRSVAYFQFGRFP